VTISTLVDTNILIDLLGPASPHRDWSLRAVESCIEEGALVVNPVVWSELASSPLSEVQLTSALGPLALRRETISFDAAFSAGKAHRQYRLAGGMKERTLADFFIGAHAQSSGHRLLTRDAARYATYFPGVDLITPQTHP
jgi:predicted nucleic acid-binding protein